jgi:GMP synthase-like glutamine amidotransferase
MHVLVIKNASAEGPGTIADHLHEAHVPVTIVDLARGGRLPAVEASSHLVVMGGPMAVYERDRTPYLEDEIRFLEKAIKARKHILGICLGSQLLAHVLGARVYSGGTREIGWYDVTLSDEGMRDPCMSTLAVPERKTAQVFQWHGDTFDLPQDAVRLASSEVYPNQAFRHADRVYALQFHIEVSPPIVSSWLKHEHGLDLPLIDARSHALYPAYRARARRFYCAFFGA